MKKSIRIFNNRSAVLGILCMFGAVESIEIDKWTQGLSIAFLGIISLILSLVSQQFYIEEK